MFPLQPLRVWQPWRRHRPGRFSLKRSGFGTGRDGAGAQLSTIPRGQEPGGGFVCLVCTNWRPGEGRDGGEGRQGIPNVLSSRRTQSPSPFACAHRSRTETDSPSCLEPLGRGMFQSRGLGSHPAPPALWQRNRAIPSPSGSWPWAELRPLAPWHGGCWLGPELRRQGRLRAATPCLGPTRLCCCFLPNRIPN